MALLCVAGSATAEKKFIASSSGAKITIAEETNGPAGSVPTVKTLNIAPTTAQGESVVAMTVSCQGQLLAVCTSEKRLVVWECQQWRVRGERTVAKRVTSLQFSESAEHILAADRAGEVTRYCVTDLSTAGEELLGHLSMLLDMVMVSHDSHVITCDRDEKIRVSKYPNSYNIETYCLGHTEFVSCICVCRKWPHILISSSGVSCISRFVQFTYSGLSFCHPILASPQAPLHTCVQLL
jgi:WD40 repeat protein